MKVKINGKERKVKCNESDICPICGSYLDYEPIELEGDMIYYPYTCENCGAKGEEWYSLEFNGHSVYNENTEWYEEITKGDVKNEK